MSAQEFLELVWPKIGYYCIATPAPSGHGYKHKVFDNIPEAAQHALALDALGQNAYFAMSSLTERFVLDPTAPSGRRVRVKTNMAHLKVFFLEVDVAKPGEWEELSEKQQSKKYETREQAIAGLKVFTKTLGWPSPTIVSSGWGFHVYWHLSESIAASEFEEVSSLMKGIADITGFRLDRAALDISRVLRVVGTHNHKREPVPVQLLKQGTATAPAALIAELRQAAEGLGVTARMPTQQFSAPDMGEGNLTVKDFPVPEFEPLLRCAALKEFVDTGGDVEYQHWMHAIQVIRFVPGGAQKVHEISSQCPGRYDPVATDNQLHNMEAKGIGPTLCTTFEQDTKACETCPYRGKFRSPISLGRVTEIAGGQTEPEVMQIEFSGEVKEITVPPPEKPFKRVLGTGVIMATTDQNGDKMDAILLSRDLYPVTRLYDERQSIEFTVWRSPSPHDGEVELVMPANVLYDRRLFSEHISNAGLYPSMEHIDNLRKYMIAYSQQLAKLAQRDERFARMGWRESGTQFVLGSKLYTPDGVKPCRIETDNKIAEAITSVGDFDTWRSAVELYNLPEFVRHQFAFGVAFAAPLMIFTNQTGGVISLVGESGEGKSTVQNLVSSVWGRPSELTVSAAKGAITEFAMRAVLSLLNNIPFCAEEITQMEPKDLAALVYAVNLGQPKLAGAAKGGLRHDPNMSWRTIMLSSSNTHLHEKLVLAEGSVATIMRVIEMRIQGTKGTYSPMEFMTRFDNVISTNYGLAGPRYMEFLTRNIDKIPEFVYATTKRIAERVSASNVERVWTALSATVIAGLHLAKKCGMHNFDVAAIEDFIVDHIVEMRDEIGSQRPSAVEHIVGYINENLRNTLVIEQEKVGYVAHVKPTSMLCIRKEVDTQRVFVAVAPFKKWCALRGISYSDVLRDLKDANVLIDRNVSKSLGAHTEFATGTIKCIVLNAATPAFVGIEGINPPKTKLSVIDGGKVA